MKRKLTMILLLCLSLIFVITACTAPAPKKEAEKAPAATEKEEGKKDAAPMDIQVVAKGFQHQFWVAVKNGAEKAAKEFGVTMDFVGPQNESAIQEQVGQLQNAINKKPSAICLAALDTKSEISLLNQAKDLKIPVIGFDSGVPDAPEGSVLATASTDNKKAAGLGATKMFEALKDKLAAATAENPVRIGLVSQEVNSASIVDRTQGFIDQMKSEVAVLENVKDQVAVVGNDKFKSGVEENKAVVIIDLSVPAQVTDAQGVTAAQTLLNKEDLIGIFGSNEFGAKCIINASKAMGDVVGEGKIVGIGFDSGKIQIDAIKNKVLYGSITQDPVSIGYDAVMLAVKAAKGEKVEDMDTGAKWYDASNVEAEDIAALLYE